MSILNNPLTPLVGLFFLFYFIFILPEKRRKAQEASMMSALKKNDRVVTIGGIHGTIVAAPAEGGVVTIRIDENSNTRIKVNRSAIAKVDFRQGRPRNETQGNGFRYEGQIVRQCLPPEEIAGSTTARSTDGN